MIKLKNLTVELIKNTIRLLNKPLTKSNITIAFFITIYFATSAISSEKPIYYKILDNFFQKIYRFFIQFYF